MAYAASPRFWIPAAIVALACGSAGAQAPIVSGATVNYTTRTIVVLGSNFGTGPAVTFDGYSLTPTLISASTLRVTVPNGVAPAMYVLTITNTTSGKTTDYTINYVPPMALNWKGAWSPATVYSVNDAVTYNGGSYASRLNGYSNVTPDSHPSAWTDLAQVPLPPLPPIQQVYQGGTATGPVKVVGLKYIIALAGIFPSGGGGSATYSEQILGEVRIFAGNFAPSGWAFCEGQLLPISQNQALFSLLGTIYGGDGITTFALPDLRATAAVHANQ